MTKTTTNNGVVELREGLTSVGEPPVVLSLAEHTAIIALNQQIAVLQAKLRRIIAEAGVDPEKPFRVEEDGTVTLV